MLRGVSVLATLLAQYMEGVPFHSQLRSQYDYPEEKEDRRQLTNIARLSTVVCDLQIAFA